MWNRKRCAEVKRIFVLLLLCIVVIAVVVAYRNYRGEWGTAPQGTSLEGAALITKGRYLAQAGNCIGCHTARGGVPFAGGRGIPTPFGTVYSSNLTPDPQTGIGQWSRDDFWRAMHNGRSKSGRFLYPAFPYTEYTRVTREDADALHAFFLSLAPVPQPNRAHDLRAPYNSQLVLAGWRALFFNAGVYEADEKRSEQWNRGAYLVTGLGHCSACHAGRNVFGASEDSLELSGGLIPMQGWYAPSLASPSEAGVQDWPMQEIVALLKNGVSEHASALGPMAEVVYRSTQHIDGADLQAMAVYLQTLPKRETDRMDEEDIPTVDPSIFAVGRKVYADRCADCHGAQGEGVAGMYPALAGNRALTMEIASNSVLSVLNGGFAPATVGNPRPFGMPPYAVSLKDEEIAAVLSYIRNAWGNKAPPVNIWDVRNAARGASTH